MLGLTVDPFLGIFLLISMIFCGKLFRENWNNKGKNWIALAWFYGVVASFSFFAIAFIPLDLT